MTQPPPLLTANCFENDKEIVGLALQMRQSALEYLYRHNVDVDDVVPEQIFKRVTAVDPRPLATLARLYPPQPASNPWWMSNSVRCAREIRDALEMLHLFCGDVIALHHIVGSWIYPMSGQKAGLPRGFARMTVTPGVPPTLEPSRFFHRLLSQLIYYFRHVDPQNLPLKVRSLLRVDRDEWGVLPFLSDGGHKVEALAYCLRLDETTSQRTWLPVPFMKVSDLDGGDDGGCSVRGKSLGSPDELAKVMIFRQGNVVQESGFFVSLTPGTMNDEPNEKETRTIVHACSGWTGDVNTSWCAAPVFCTYYSDGLLERFVSEGHTRECACTDLCTPESIEDELMLRKLPGYFHFVPAMRSALGDRWPRKIGQSIFVAIPRQGIESELVEMLMLEELVNRADAGEAEAQLLLEHVVQQSGAATIAEVMAAQRSRLQQQMVRDQQQQLRIHAEAVARHDARQARISSGRAPEAPASAPRVVQEEEAASSSSAGATSGVDINGELEALCGTGRKKYDTIVKAAMRFLYSLKPERVNKSGGSHVVFHFGRAGPVTLVQPHSGGSKDNTCSAAYCTRLFAALEQAALVQFDPARLQLKQ